MKKLLALSLALAMALFLVACNSGTSESATTTSVWPEGTVTLTVPASPGGGTDTAARILADFLQRTTGEAFNVVNDTTGGNIVAVQNARHAKNDGSEILFFHVSTLMSYYQNKLDFNPAEELTIICSCGIQANGALCTVSDAPYSTGEEFIAYAKENPGKIRVGVTMGGNSQAIVQCFADDVGIELTLVDAGNEADWVTAMMSGTIDVALLTPTSASQYIEAGEFKALVVSSDAEDSLNWPGVQNMAELGGQNIWILEQYMFGPKDMDQATIDAINEAVSQFANDAEAMEKYETAMQTAFVYKNHEEATASYLEKAEIAKAMSEAMGFDVSGK